MSYRAMEQLLCVSGVVGMCMLLYVVLCLVEYLIQLARGTHKRRDMD